MWWTTTRWRLNGRGWALAFAITCLAFGLVGLGELFPPLRPIAKAIVGLAIVVGLVLAVRARSREFGEYDLRRPEERERRRQRRP